MTACFPRAFSAAAPYDRKSETAPRAAPADSRIANSATTRFARSGFETRSLQSRTRPAAISARARLSHIDAGVQRRDRANRKDLSRRVRIRQCDRPAAAIDLRVEALRHHQPCAPAR